MWALSLEVGPLSDTIAVVADAAQVNTADAQIGRTVDNTEIVHLPLVNRDVYALLNLTPGVEFSEVNAGSFGYPEQRTFINGGADSGAGSVNYFLDGGANLLPLRNTGGIVPNPDSVEEFRVVTNSYSAEFGRFAGGVVDVITKSGTNRLHGSAFEFLRNDKLSANSWGVRRKPPLRRNQFGVSLGGPVHKDQTFFFLSYSALRHRLNEIRSSAVVPDARQRTGDFSAIQTPIFDPYSTPRTPFSGNQIPLQRFDKAASNILDQWIPAPNLSGNSLEASQPRPSNSDEGLLKIDHNLGCPAPARRQLFRQRRLHGHRLPEPHPGRGQRSLGPAKFWLQAAQLDRRGHLDHLAILRQPVPRHIHAELREPREYAGHQPRRFRLQVSDSGHTLSAADRRERVLPARVSRFPALPPAATPTRCATFSESPAAGIRCEWAASGR